MTAAPVPPAPEERIPGLRPALTDRDYFDLLVEHGLDDPEEQERSWQILKRAMNETRELLGQPPVRE